MAQWLQNIALLAGTAYLVFRVGKTVRTLTGLWHDGGRRAAE